MQDLQHLFDEVEDPRRSNAARHDLHEMLAVALPAAICGGDRRQGAAALHLVQAFAAEAVRAHWWTGNSLHWIPDAAMNEDGTGNRTGNGPQNLAMIRSMALNPARAVPEKRKTSMRSKPKRAGWDDNFLLELARAAAALGKEAKAAKV